MKKLQEFEEDVIVKDGVLYGGKLNGSNDGKIDSINKTQEGIFNTFGIPKKYWTIQPTKKIT